MQKFQNYIAKFYVMSKYYNTIWDNPVKKLLIKVSTCIQHHFKHKIWNKQEMKGLLIAQIGNKRSEICSSYNNMYLEEDKNLLFSSAVNTSRKLLCNIYKKRTTHTALQRNIEFSLKIIMQLCVTSADY